MGDGGSEEDFLRNPARGATIPDHAAHVDARRRQRRKSKRTRPSTAEFWPRASCSFRPAGSSATWARRGVGEAKRGGCSTLSFLPFGTRCARTNACAETAILHPCKQALMPVCACAHVLGEACIRMHLRMEKLKHTQQEEELRVPDHAYSLKEAISLALDEQTIYVRAGEHRWRGELLG